MSSKPEMSLQHEMAPVDEGDDNALQPAQESVWDYPRPPVVVDCPKRIRVVFNGVTIADSCRTKRMLETSHPPVYYIPPDDIRMQYLQPNPKTTVCEYKGEAGYYNVEVDGQRVINAAWSYHEPTAAYAEIKNYLAFYAHRMDGCYVDDEKVATQEGRFYGGWITSDVRG